MATNHFGIGYGLAEIDNYQEFMNEQMRRQVEAMRNPSYLHDYCTPNDAPKKIEPQPNNLLLLLED